MLLEEKKISQIEIVQKYLSYFSSTYENPSAVASLLKLSGEEVSRLKSSGLKLIRKLTQEKSLHLL
jgi:hypothetical protein